MACIIQRYSFILTINNLILPFLFFYHPKDFKERRTLPLHTPASRSGLLDGWIDNSRCRGHQIWERMRHEYRRRGGLSRKFVFAQWQPFGGRGHLAFTLVFVDTVPASAGVRRQQPNVQEILPREGKSQNFQLYFYFYRPLSECDKYCHVSAKTPLAPHFLVLTLLFSSFWIIIHMFWRNNEAFYCKISSFFDLRENAFSATLRIQSA